MSRPIPQWFTIAEEATPHVMRRIAEAVSSNAMGLQVKSASMLAHWFTLDSLLLANQANRDAIRRIVETNDDCPARMKADHDMREAMRTDLGIVK